MYELEFNVWDDVDVSIPTNEDPEIISIHEIVTKHDPFQRMSIYIGEYYMNKLSKLIGDELSRL